MLFKKKRENPSRQLSEAMLANLNVYLRENYEDTRSSVCETQNFDVETLSCRDFLPMAPSVMDGGGSGLPDLLENLDAGFSETLLTLIDRTGKKDSEIYRKANVDRKLFSKIRNNPDYKPSKTTAIAFAVALELDLEETEDFISRAGYAFSHSSKFDVIIEYFIKEKVYDIFVINEALFAYDQCLLGV